MKMNIRIVFFVMGLMATLLGCGKSPTLHKITPATKIIAFGDSLTFGYGIDDPENDSYPAVLKKELGCSVMNAGVPGELSSAGLKRLKKCLAENSADLLILCHGGNDMLQKKKKGDVAKNLEAMILLAKKHGLEVVIIGVPQPSLTLSVPAFYQNLATKYNAPYDGAILPKILSNSTLKSDYIHPNEDGYAALAKAIAKLIKKSESQ